MSRPPAKTEQIVATTEGSSIDLDSLAAQIGPFLRPEKKDQGLQVVTTMIRKVHSGPLPAPEDFAAYEETLPGSANRIFEMTEREQAHRHRQEDRVVTGEYLIRIVGQIGALLALAMLVSLVAYCAFIGQPVAAAVITAIGAIVVGFVKYTARRIDEPEPEKPKPKPRAKRK